VFTGCENAAFYEYPILTTGVYGGGLPGPFRVIFSPDDTDFSSRNGKSCGIIYHPASQIWPIVSLKITFIHDRETMTAANLGASIFTNECSNPLCF
jgi:hypothetical protein